MGTYRKLPVEIEAFKWTGSHDQTEDPVWIVDAINRGEVTVGNDPARSEGFILRIKTLEGTMDATPGDYIIKGLKGELYPCKPDIFEASYEEVK